jgi:hypothetical protein
MPQERDQLGYQQCKSTRQRHALCSTLLTALIIQLLLNGCVHALCLQYTYREYRTSLPFIALVSLFQGVYIERARYMGRYLQGGHLDQQCSLQDLIIAIHLDRLTPYLGATQDKQS